MSNILHRRNCSLKIFLEIRKDEIFIDFYQKFLVFFVFLNFFLVEYALKAVDAAGLAIGLRGKDGVVFAVEKPIQTKLYENATNSRILNVDSHIGKFSKKLQKSRKFYHFFLKNPKIFFICFPKNPKISRIFFIFRVIFKKFFQIFLFFC